MPRPYPSEFRERALELLRAARTVVDVAADLGVAQSCLYRWKQQDLIDRGMNPESARRRGLAIAVSLWRRKVGQRDTSLRMFPRVRRRRDGRSNPRPYPIT